MHVGTAGIDLQFRLLNCRRVLTNMALGPHGNGQSGVRESVVVTLTDDRGETADGEASPLPGYSPDDLHTVEAYFGRQQAARWQLCGDTFLQALTAMDERLAHSPPSARFAIETAAAGLAAKALDCELTELLTSGPALSESVRMPVAYVVTTLEEVDRVVSASVLPLPTLKIKLGRGVWEEELRFLTAVKTRWPELPMRLDGNGRLGPGWRAAVELIEPLAPAWLEEVVDPSWLWSDTAQSASDVPLAVDESLRGRSPGAFPRGVRYAVLKPSCLGGILSVWRWVEAARTAGVEPVISHTLEPGPARSVLVALARAWMAPGLAAGLGPYPGEPLDPALRGSEWLRGSVP